jgi:pSer/pThr/pTyr-binding forkhead associated (FHA) protein
MAHRSISRYHAALINEREMGTCLVDLGSKSGSFINGKRIEKNIPVFVPNKSELSFGVSTRRYHIEIDFSPVEM